MNVVYKYTVDGSDGEVSLEMPVGAIITHFDMQYGKLVFWAFVDTEQSKIEMRKLAVVGTGQELPKSRGYLPLGTVLLAGGTLVLHAFELVD